ncbi:germin-like protein 9-1 [Panicum miliaceum]|uniref:Germin-like protein n=1 Tax=Panicum miliaceum TaxID=4540 RepID=A0A3L6QTE8_PANMI|nr:germin-like protein 9-1 [Panicum miliaceum]
MALALGLRRLLLLFAVAAIHQLPRSARAGDPDILTDFLAPLGAEPDQLNGTFFTYARLVSGLAGDPGKFTVSKATGAEFPALLGQSVSYAALVFGPGTVNPPHIHPRASELLVVVQGPLVVGLVDAARNGTVHTAALETGDMFVFPKGMVHYQLNNGTGVARAFSAFGGATPGTISLPTALFETDIDDAVLEKSFRTDEATVEELKHDLREAPGPAPSPSPSPSSAAVALVGGSPLAASLVCAAAAFSFVL